jgi:hypothetical protein
VNGAQGQGRSAKPQTCVFIAATFSRPDYAFSFPRGGWRAAWRKVLIGVRGVLRSPRRAPSRRATSGDIWPPSARLLTSGTGTLSNVRTSPDDLRITAQVGGAGTPEAGTRLPGAGSGPIGNFASEISPSVPRLPRAPYQVPRSRRL